MTTRSGNAPSATARVLAISTVTAAALLLYGSGAIAQPKPPAKKPFRINKPPVRSARPIRPRPDALRAAARAKPTAAAASSAAAAAKPADALPGEAEFNECIKIPRSRRIKVTLKPDSTLNDLVGWISSMTCKKFIIGSNLHTQKVTLISPTTITAQEAYRAFLSAIDVMGLTVVPSGRYLKVLQGNWAIQSPIPTYGADTKRQLPTSDETVTRLVRVDHVDVNQLLLVLNKMKSRSGDVTAYRPTNMLIMTDSANNIRRLMEIIKELDVPITGEKIWVVRLRHADVQDIEKLLAQIFAQKGKANIPRTGKSKSDEEGIPSASKIISDPTTNSLIIVASATAFQRIASLLKKLDVADSGTGSQRIHVYYLENADAEEMGQTLASLTGGTAAASRSRTRRGKSKSTPAASASLFEGEVKVSPDKATNSLVIVASTRDFINLRGVIRKLDIPRRQVFVEASIMEITLNKERKIGFGYHGGGLVGEGDSQSIIFGGVQHSALGTLAIDPLALMGLAVGARGALIEGSAELLGLPSDIPGFGVMFQALQTNSNVNVLSSPHILTTDNEEAEITVGQNIPFQGALMGGSFGAAAAGAAGANFSSLIPAVSVQRQDVALKLKLTPHVNDSDMVRLELEQEVSDIASPNFNNLGPATSKRTAKTTVVVRDQQTVVIGGLMGDRVQDTESKVPLLGDIPILGYLFKHTTKTKQKTNLLIVLTPYVIRDQSDLRRIFQKKLRERREFIERYTSFSSRDPGAEIDYRHKRGLIGEINRVGLQIEAEARLLQQAREATDEKVDPVEMPEGMSPSPEETPPTSPTVAPGTIRAPSVAPAIRPVTPTPRPSIR